VDSLHKQISKHTFMLPESLKAALKAFVVDLLQQRYNLHFLSDAHFEIEARILSESLARKVNKKRKRNQRKYLPLIRIAFQYAYRPLFVTGRYRKLQRGVSHSAWFLQEGEQRKGDYATSVEEEITHDLIALCHTNTITFASSGREDIDVRMLGNGRPFACKILNPLCVPDQINELNPKNGHGTYIDILQLQYHIFDKSQFDLMNKTIANKRKRYRCVVITSQKIPKSVEKLQFKVPFTLNQNTPLRVLHRRAPLIRKKTIHALNIVEWINDFCFLLDIETSSGTYVKEFCHGDFGRSTPSLTDLIDEFEGECDIIQLDVMDLIPDEPSD